MFCDNSNKSNEWESRYQQGQTGWDRGAPSPNLDYWLDADLLTPCRILIPGCGNGHEVIALAEKGFDVTAIDIAPSPINNLKKALDAKQLNATLIQADFFTWVPEQQFDAIYEQTSLCALPPERWQAYEACLHNWLTLRGKLFAQFMQTGKEDGPPFHCDITTMTDLFTVDKWHWSKQHETSVIHSNGLFERLYVLEKNSYP
jgi:cyclopropane fatty-acyl-phospholipid synthase-like methyltransferase